MLLVKLLSEVAMFTDGSLTVIEKTAKYVGIRKVFIRCGVYQLQHQLWEFNLNVLT